MSLTFQAAPSVGEILRRFLGLYEAFAGTIANVDGPPELVGAVHLFQNSENPDHFFLAFQARESNWHYKAGLFYASDEIGNFGLSEFESAEDRQHCAAKVAEFLRALECGVIPEGLDGFQ